MVSISRIAGPLNISGEMAKSTTQAKSIWLLSRNILQTVSEEAEDEKMGTYPARRQYLAFPETKDGRQDSNTFARRRTGADCRHIMKKVCPIFN